MANVIFNILNRSGTEVLPMTGYSLPFEVFTFKPDFTSVGNYISDKKIIWSFGDNSYSTELTAKHFYSYPGTYPVTLTVFNSSGDSTVSTYTSSVTIFNYINDILLLTVDQPLIQVSGTFNQPIVLTRYNSWQTTLSTYNTVINLSVSGNRAPFYSAEKYYKDKNAQFYSSSKFQIETDLGLTVVNQVSTTNDILYAVPNGNSISVTTSAGIGNSVVAGSSGYALFYYVEDYYS